VDLLRLGQSLISGRTEYAGCAKIAAIESSGLLSVYALQGLMNRIEWMDIAQAVTADDMAAARVLLCEYADALPIDLGYQDFSQELSGLPGKYTPPRGRLLLAREESHLHGCVALRPLSESIGEIKRLYVRPESRGLGLGRTLAKSIIEEARRIGYERLVLDTLSDMIAAIRLYEAVGFSRCAAYYETPIPNTVFMSLDLRA
jgi:putative acetyltransferase